MNSYDIKAIICTFIYIFIFDTGIIHISMTTGTGEISADTISYLLPLSIILLIYSFIADIKFFKRSGYGKINLKGFIWFSPFILLLTMLMIMFIFTGNFENNIDFIILVFLNTLLLAASEETIFRGILLNGLLTKFSQSKAIVISAFIYVFLDMQTFMMISGFGQRFYMLLNTFFTGILFAVIAIKMNSIIFIILYHGLWSGIMISNVVSNSYISNISFFIILVQILGAVVYFYQILYREKTNTV